MIEAWAERALAEAGGDIEQAVNRLSEKGWTEEEARAELAECLRLGVHANGRRKNPRASDGRG